MGNLPQLSLIRQQRMTAEEMRQLPCMELVDNAQGFIGYLIIPSPLGGMTIWDEIKNHAESLGVRSNIVVPHQVIEAANTLNEPYPHLVKARAIRQANLKKKKVGVT